MVVQVLAPLPEMVEVPDAPPPISPPAPLSEEWRLVWSEFLPFQYRYENFRPLTRVAPEVKDLQVQWMATGTFAYYEVWDAIKDPALVGVNPKEKLAGGLLARATNLVNAVRRYFGDKSQNNYTLLARWGDESADLLTESEVIAAVEKDADDQIAVETRAFSLLSNSSRVKAACQTLKAQLITA